jgi:rhamnulokinase
MSKSLYVAVDLGAESGRVIFGKLESGKLSLEDVHRFPNQVVQREGHFYWDLEAIEHQIGIGLRKFADVHSAHTDGLPASGISTNSWGVDYVWVDKNFQPLAPAFSYRDPRTEKSMEILDQQLSLAKIYAETGIQLMAINTIFQLEAELRNATAEGATVPPAEAEMLLNIADYFNARLSGKGVSEQSLASTTQLYQPMKRDWSDSLIESLGLPREVFPPVVASGSVINPLQVPGPFQLEKSPAWQGTQVIATCSHDTGAAVAAIPVAENTSWAYLSSGTWSLLGAELDAPLLTDAARQAGFTNEAGLAGTIRFLKNIVGLWIVQECRRDWEQKGLKFSYEEITQLASAQSGLNTILPVSDSRLLQPGNMPAKIEAICSETNQPVPNSPGQMVRVVLESLAEAYAAGIRQLQELTGKKYQVLHIVGGGARNELLNQLTANATGLDVVAGPVEGTAIGNILIQGLALGQIGSVPELRSIVRNSFSTKLFQPAKFI